MNCLIAITANLAGMLLILSLMAFALARLSWHGRGTIVVLAMIILAGQFWMAPAMIISSLGSVRSASYSIWFGNWLVSGFAVILLCQTVRWIPRELEDSARIDGCGVFGIWWHVLLPLVRRELALIALLTAMATGVPLCAALIARESGIFFQPLSALLPAAQHLAHFGIALLIGCSLLATLPVIVIFFFARATYKASRSATDLET